MKYYRRRKFIAGARRTASARCEISLFAVSAPAVVMDFDQLFPGRFLKAGELQGRDASLTVSAIALEDLPTDQGTKRRGVISFAESPKQWVLNRTNALCLRAMFGRDTDIWIGKKVCIYPAEIKYGDSDLAIRVRGSPDIAADMEITIRLSRKRPQQMVLKKTHTQKEEIR